MNLDTVFHRHGHVTVDADLIHSVINHDWQSIVNAHDDNPLRPGVTINFAVNSVTQQGAVLDPELFDLQQQLCTILDQIKLLLPNLMCLKAMLVNLPCHTAQHWHVDPRVVHELSHRIHVAIVTNDSCRIETNTRQQHFAVGEVWELNNIIPHRANNGGNTNRIHLVTDWIRPDVAQQQHLELWQHRDDVKDNVGRLYHSLAGQCINFTPEIYDQ